MVEGVSLPKPIRQLDGVLECDCVGNTPIPAATLRITPARHGAAPVEWERTVRTDGDGRFRAGGLSPGAYDVEVRARDFYLRSFRVVIAPDGSVPVHLGLRPTGAVRVFPGSETFVTGGSIPLYPAESRRRGNQGEVTLRLSMDGDEAVDIDVEAGEASLGEAARAAISTWRFRATTASVLAIRFVYRLREGGCRADPGTVVTMRLPNDITVEANRGPC